MFCWYFGLLISKNALKNIMMTLLVSCCYSINECIVNLRKRATVEIQIRRLLAKNNIFTFHLILCGAIKKKKLSMLTSDFIQVLHLGSMRR